MRTFIVSLLLAIASCGDAPDREMAVTRSAAADSERFVAGERWRYRFEWTVDVQARQEWLVEDLEVEGGIDLAGLLDVHVYGRTNDGWLLGCSFAELERHGLRALGHDALAEPETAAQLVGPRALVVVDPTGTRAPRVAFDPDTPSVFRHLMSGLLVHFDLQPSREDGRWEALVPGGHGLAEVVYARDVVDPRRLQRSLGSFERLDALLGAAPIDPAVWGEGSITLDERGLPLRIELEEAVTVTDGQTDGTRLQSRAAASFHRTEVASFTVEGLPDLAGLHVLDLADGPDDSEAQREQARRFAEGLSIVDVDIEVDAVGNGLRPPAGFMVRSTGLLRAEPELAEEVGGMLLDAEQDAARLLALDILTSAGTTEAQAVMVAVLGRLENAGDPMLPIMLQRLSLLPDPRPQTVQFAADVHDRAVRADDAGLKNATMYVLGSLARRSERRDPAAAEAMRDRLRRGLADALDEDTRVAALAGIGNAAAAEDLDLVLAHVDAESEAVRAQTASALRRYEDVRARAALLSMARDEAPAVAMSALSTLDMYALPDEDLAELGRMVVDDEISREVTTSLVNVLSRHFERSPAMHAGMWTLLARETDLRRRIRIERLLGIRV